MMRILKRLVAAWLVLFAASAALAQDRPRIVTVNYALQYFAERLVGDAAEVVFPVPRDVDPSFWRPSIADITMIQEADLILLNGAGFATWVDRVSLPRSRLVNTTAAIEDRFIRTESITHSHGEGGEHSHEGVASYTWLDPTLAIAQAESVAEAIVARDLAPAAQVDERLTALRVELEALDAEMAGNLKGFAGVAIITTHPRYQYLARRYDLDVTSLEWEAGAMPTEAQIEGLRSRVDETGAQVLIWEAMPPAGAFEMTGELGLSNSVFAPLAHGVDGRTYIDVLKADTAAISHTEAK